MRALCAPSSFLPATGLDTVVTPPSRDSDRRRALKMDMPPLVRAVLEDALQQLSEQEERIACFDMELEQAENKGYEEGWDDGHVEGKETAKKEVEGR